MSFEVRNWGRPGSILKLKVSDISAREESSSEINRYYGEGGAWNANYRTVEAVAIVANLLGRANGFRYGQQFIVKTGGLDEVIFEFDYPENREAAERTMQEAMKEELPVDIAAKDQLSEHKGVKCPLCSGEMKLAMFETTSYWQCKNDETHRMSLTEWSNVRDGEKSKTQITEAIKERAAELAKQLAAQSA